MQRQQQQQQRADDAAAAAGQQPPSSPPRQPPLPQRAARRKRKGAVAPPTESPSQQQQPARFEALRCRAERSSAAVSYRLRRAAALHSQSGDGDAAAMHHQAPQIDFERLVALVRPYPYLYDRTEPEFKDVALKNHRWQLIGAEFGITGEHAAQKFRTMKTKYKDLRRARELAGVAAMGRPRWRYYDIMDDFMRTRDRETGNGSAEPAMVISNIFSVAETSTSGADAEHEAAIVPEVLPDERAADDGPAKKKIKREPREEEEDESRDTQRTDDSGGDNQLLPVDDSLGSSQVHTRPPQRLHPAALDYGAASTPAWASGGTQDAFHFFGMMIADRLRLLPRVTALRALNAMHQVLFEHETGSER